MFFGFLFPVVPILSGAPFFANQNDASIRDYLYFSFITLTTVGFGDLTPRTDLGRALTVIEAVLGQLYLVSAVALVVGNIGRRRGDQG